MVNGTVDAEGVITNQNLIDTWLQKDVDARTIIHCNVEPHLQVIIEGCTTAATMWERLLLQFAQAAAANANLLLAKFFEYKYEKEHNVMSHIMRLTSMAEELRNLESPLTEQQLTMKILHSLPTSYRAFQSAWLSVPAPEQTIQNLTARFIGEEALTKNINKGEMDPADVAFFAGQTHSSHGASDVAFHATRGIRGGYPGFRRGSRGFRARGGGFHGTKTDFNNIPNYGDTNSTITCFYCNQVGHKSYNCPTKRNNERKQQRDDSFNKSRTSSGCVSSSLCIVARQPDHWYADSAASSHMTDKRSFFTTFKEIPPGTWKVNGIGGVQLEARGIGNINVTTLIEGEETKGTFLDVLFVPNLSVNLFSFGSATEAGLEVHFKGTKV
ncbi:hypothetical protein GHT06_018428 [Daphnia sinensis]|uniref:CCHC-type domain-containing protein n=1 Tax=Daphnia sinensis TaxID=1820382 RepID=A0AAD5KMI9_9CRUS|nr:hypothetical protein GHT06_018428 [Daphnia sinensis]